MNELLRPLLRSALKWLTILVLRKHKPTVIAILGEGQTSITREVVYTIIQTTFPARRNQETPEAEFSVPLTVLAYPRYPKSYLEWLWVLLKTTVQIFTLRPFFHFLVLELNAPDPAKVQLWLDIVKPAKTLQAPISSEAELLEPHFALGWEVAEAFDISENKVIDVLSSFQLPEGRIDVKTGKNGALLLDATHYYIPIKLEAITELIPSEAKRLIYYGRDRAEMATLRELDDRWVFNPSDLIHTADDVIVLRGLRTQMFPLYKHLKSA